MKSFAPLIIILALLSTSTLSHAQESYSYAFLDTLRKFSIAESTPTLSIIQPKYEFDFEKPQLGFVAPVPEPKFKTDELPLHLGEFNASGIIHRSRIGTIYGAGRQDNYIGLGVVNSVDFIYAYQLSDRAFLSANLNATKLSAFRGYDQFFGGGATFTYLLNDKMTLTAFGNYAKGRFFEMGNLGAYMSLDVTSHWGVDLGAQHFYDPIRMRWDSNPIVAPYYKINKKVKVGMDFGPVLLDAVRSWIK